MLARILITVVSCALWLPAAARAEDWPQFRGQSGSGLSGETQLPREWSVDKNVLWKVKVPGYGWSSPVVWGDKVFITTAYAPGEQRPARGFGGGGGGFGGGPFGGPPRSGEILPSFLKDMLGVSAAQKKQLEKLQTDVDGKLSKILTAEQNKQLKEPPESPGRGGRGQGGGGPPGRGRFGAPPQPGQVLPPALRETLKLSADQKKQVDELQKEVDGRLANVLTAEQNKQLNDMREGLGRGGFGRGGPGGGGRGGFGRGAAPPSTIYRWELFCLDRNTGKVLWDRVALEGKPRIAKQAANTYATETPVTDGERVYAYFGMHGLYCYDVEGKPVWKHDLGAYPMMMGQGTASSPILDGDRLFLQIDNEQKSFLVALDRKTGNELWRVPREEHSNFSTPLIWKNKVRTELVTSGSQKVRSYDPASGKVLWELNLGVNRCTASPVADDEQLYVGQGGGGGGGFGGGRGGMRGGAGALYAVRAGASGDVTPRQGEMSSAGVAWSQPRVGPGMSSPLLYQGYLYILEQNGMVSCFDAKSGKPAYQRERVPNARAFWASPWAYDGKVFCLDDGGTTHVLQAGPTFKVLGKNPLNDQFWATPALAGGSIILRGVEGVYCVKQ